MITTESLPRFAARRIDGAWHVVDTATGETRTICSGGSAGAAEAVKLAEQFSAETITPTETVEVAPTARAVGGLRSADGFKAWRTAHELTQTELANLLDVTMMTIYRWENGASAIPRTVELALRYLGSANGRRLITTATAKA